LAFGFGELESIAVDLLEIGWFRGELLSDDADVLSLRRRSVICVAAEGSASPARDEGVPLEFANRGTLQEITQGQMSNLVKLDVQIGQVLLRAFYADPVWGLLGVSRY